MAFGAGSFRLTETSSDSEGPDQPQRTLVYGHLSGHNRPPSPRVWEP